MYRPQEAFVQNDVRPPQPVSSHTGHSCRLGTGAVVQSGPANLGHVVDEDEAGFCCLLSRTAPWDTVTSRPPPQLVDIPLVYMATLVQINKMSDVNALKVL